MRVELGGELGQIRNGLRGHGLEAGDVALHFAVCGARFLRDLVHGGDKVGNTRHQRAFDLAHVLMRAAQNFLQQNVGFAQALEQGGGIRAQHVLGLQNLGNRGGRALL